MIQIPRLPQRTFTYLLLLGLLLSLAACGSPAPSSALTVYVSLFEGDAGSRSIAAFDAQTGLSRWRACKRAWCVLVRFSWRRVPSKWCAPMMAARSGSMIFRRVITLRC